MESRTSCGADAPASPGEVTQSTVQWHDAVGGQERPGQGKRYCLMRFILGSFFSVGWPELCLNIGNWPQLLYRVLWELWALLLGTSVVNKQQQKSWPASSNAVRAMCAIKCIYFVRHLLSLGSNGGLHRNRPLYRRSGNGCSTLPVTPTAEFETSGRAGKSQTILMHQKGRRVIPSLPLQRFSLKWSSSILGKVCANVYGSASLI